jgi:RimJ/RimL family protein N-acetyltransferase
MPPVINPILLDIPPELETPRQLLRIPRPGDGLAIYEAVKVSHAQLYPWLFWTERLTTPENAESEMRQAGAHFLLRQDMVYLLFAKDDPRLLGTVTIHHFDWGVPACELGYWLHSGETGKGYMVEAVQAITEFCFVYLQMERIEIWCDTRNPASARVAQRAEYSLQTRVKNAYRDNDGNLTDADCYFKLPAGADIGTHIEAESEHP